MSRTFFIDILTAFFDLVKPDSTNVKPACIKNTKIPDNKIQRIVKSALASKAIKFKCKGVKVI